MKLSLQIKNSKHLCYMKLSKSTENIGSDNSILKKIKQNEYVHNKGGLKNYPNHK